MTKPVAGKKTANAKTMTKRVADTGKGKKPTTKGGGSKGPRREGARGDSLRQSEVLRAAAVPRAAARQEPRPPRLTPYLGSRTSRKPTPLFASSHG